MVEYGRRPSLNSNGDFPSRMSERSSGFMMLPNTSEPQTLAAIDQALDTFIQNGDGGKERTVFGSILRDRSVSQSFTALYRYRNEFSLDVTQVSPIPEFREFIDDPALNIVLSLTLGKQDTYSRFLRSFILARRSFSEVATDFVQLETQAEDTDLEVIEGNGWNNCPRSEVYMEESLEEEAVVLINGFLLVKKNGHPTGLCLQTTSTAHGTFVEGSWYSPFEQESISKVKSALERKKPSVDIDSGKFVFIRDSNAFGVNNYSLLRRAQRYVGL